MEFRSNVFYNWGRGFAGYNEDEATLIRYNFIDNAYIAGPDSAGALAFRERNRLARAWFADNSMNGVVPADPWSLVTGPVPGRLPASRPGRRRAGRGRSGASPWRSVLGARRRLAARRRRCARGRERPRPHGPPYRQPGRGRRLAGAGRRARRSPTRDRDGMPDAWERAGAALDPARADGNDDRDGDGMTNIEDWLAERAAAGAAMRIGRRDLLLGTLAAGLAGRAAAQAPVAARARRRDRPVAGGRARHARDPAARGGARAQHRSRL